MLLLGIAYLAFGLFATTIGFLALRKFEESNDGLHFVLFLYSFGPGIVIMIAGIFFIVKWATS